MHGYFNTPLHILSSERVGNRHPKLRNYLRAPWTRPMGLGSDFGTPVVRVGVKQVCAAWRLLEERHQLATGHVGKTRLFFPLLSFRGSSSGPWARPTGNTVVGYLV